MVGANPQSIKPKHTLNAKQLQSTALTLPEILYCLFKLRGKPFNHWLV